MIRRLWGNLVCKLGAITTSKFVHLFDVIVGMVMKKINKNGKEELKWDMMKVREDGRNERMRKGNGKQELCKRVGLR